MNHSSAGPPFYLWNPYRTKFVPTPQHPKTLGAQLNEIRAFLLDELDDYDIPQKKKHGTMEHLVNHNMAEMVRDMQVASQAVNHSSEDKCTLRQTLEDAKTSRPNKRLHHFDNNQMIGFKLQAQPEGVPVFASHGFAPVERKVSSDDLRRQKKLERRRRRKERIEAKGFLLNTGTEDESSLSQKSQYPFSSQDTFTSLDNEIFQPKRKIIGNGPSLETAMDLSELVFQQQKQSSRLFSSVASKKSVAHALKGVRGLTVTAMTTSSRGRGHLKRPGKIVMVRKPTALKPTRRGRGRPRKNFVSGNLGRAQPVQLKPKPVHVPVPMLSLSRSPSPPSPHSKTILLSSPPPQVVPVPQQNLEPVSISKFCGLKMTMKLNRPMSQTPSPAPVSSQSTPENSRHRPRLICKIKIPKKYQSPKPKPVAVIEPVQLKPEVIMEDDDDDEFDALLDTY